MSMFQLTDKKFCMSYLGIQYLLSWTQGMLTCTDGRASVLKMPCLTWTMFAHVCCTFLDYNANRKCTSTPELSDCQYAPRVRFLY